MTAFDLAAFLPYRLTMLAQRTSRRFSVCYKNLGLSVPDWRILAQLGAHGPLEVRDLAARTEMEKSRISRAAVRLEAADLIVRRKVAGDGRLVTLELTQNGRDTIDAIAPRAAQFEQKIVEALGPEDGQNLTRLLTRLEEIT